ncbi:MAG: S8/S53 family peptidase [Alphaproteobacteria bacterium]|nr:S8/S53 family peptidase [Alphaproteobacteria bacterium]
MVKAREALAMLPRRPGSDGEIDWGEIEIAQIDTGYTEHAVFGPWSNGTSPTLFVDDGVNFIEPGTRPFDSLDYKGIPGHGTRILSVLCGDLPGSMVGVAPGVPTIPYRSIRHVVIDSKSARKRIAAAIRHATDVNRAEIISMSLGFPQMSLFGQRHLGEAVDHAYEQGIIVVAAGGQIIDRVTYPGKFSRSIGVGGIRPDRNVWFRYDKSMAKRSIDIWGPADDMYRANSVLQNGGVVEAPYGRGDGTSYATPMSLLPLQCGWFTIATRSTISIANRGSGSKLSTHSFAPQASRSKAITGPIKREAFSRSKHS